MSGRILINIDEDAYRKVRKLLTSMRVDFPKRAIGSIQRSMTKVKNVVVKNTAEIVNLTQKRITEDLTVEVSGDISIPKLDEFKIILRSTGVPIGLINFVTNKTGYTWYNPKPLRVKIYTKGTTYVFNHAFLAPGRGGSGMHMWERRDRIGLPWNPLMPYWALPHEMRFPIERLTTVRIQDIQGNPIFLGVIMEEGSALILKDLSFEIDACVEDFSS